MAISATTIWMFAYFAILWLRIRRNRRSRRRRALLEASRRRLAALYAEQEEMHAVLSVLCKRRFFLSTLQRRSSWMMPRSTDFSANTIQSWEDRRWMANFRLNKATFRYLRRSVVATLRQGVHDLREHVIVPLGPVQLLLNAVLTPRIDQELRLRRRPKLSTFRHIVHTWNSVVRLRTGSRYSCVPGFRTGSGTGLKSL